MMMKDFKQFVSSGNVLGIGVAVVLGAAFGALMGTLIDYAILPVVSYLTGGVDSAEMFIALDGKRYPSLVAAQDAGVAVFGWGMVLQALISFVTIAGATILFVQIVRRNQSTQEPNPSSNELLVEIRDLLKQVQ